jgi:hypothetical protein
MARVEDYTEGIVQVHEGVTIQVLVPYDAREAVSIAWTRNPYEIEEMKRTAHLVTTGEDMNVEGK